MLKQAILFLGSVMLGMLVVSSFPVTIHALINNGTDQQIIEIADEALKLDLKPIAQDYPNKQITLSLTINPSISSGKVSVKWIYDGNLFTAVGGDQDIIDLNADQQYVIKKVLKPVDKYKPLEVTPTSVGVKVAAAAYNRNYVSVRKAEFKINSVFETVPEFTNYSQIKNLYFTFYTVMAVIGGIIIIGLVLYGIKRFRTYLNTD